MPNIVYKCEIPLYADCTLIFTEADTIEQCYHNLSHNMYKMKLRLNNNKLNETKANKINRNWR